MHTFITTFTCVFLCVLGDRGQFAIWARRFRGAQNFPILMNVLPKRLPKCEKYSNEENSIMSQCAVFKIFWLLVSIKDFRKEL
eukprot:Pgem_evm1s7175